MGMHVHESGTYDQANSVNSTAAGVPKQCRCYRTNEPISNAYISAKSGRSTSVNDFAPGDHQVPNHVEILHQDRLRGLTLLEGNVPTIPAITS